MTPTRFLTAADGTKLAYRQQRGAGPTVVFLPGFNSDMTGGKAEHLAARCQAAGRGFLRLDYSGHGESGGDFADGSIGRWCADALAVIDARANGPVVLVGSSMGGWIALLVALARPGQVVGLVGIAAAPDFTEALIWASLPPADRVRLLEDGRLQAPGGYDPPVHITRTLIEDGRTHLLLEAPIDLPIPVRLLHGQADDAVPWQRALVLAERLTGGDVQVVLVKDGDHRLSRPQDLALLAAVLDALLAG